MKFQSLSTTRRRLTGANGCTSLLDQVWETCDSLGPTLVHAGTISHVWLLGVGKNEALINKVLHFIHMLHGWCILITALWHGNQTVWDKCAESRWWSLLLHGERHSSFPHLVTGVALLHPSTSKQCCCNHVKTQHYLLDVGKQMKQDAKIISNWKSTNTTIQVQNDYK